MKLHFALLILDENGKIYNQFKLPVCWDDEGLAILQSVHNINAKEVLRSEFLKHVSDAFVKFVDSRNKENEEDARADRIHRALGMLVDAFDIAEGRTPTTENLKK